MKRFLSLMIAVIMVLSMVPTSFATELDGIVIANQGEVIFLDDEADTTDVQAEEEPEEISEVPAETEVVFEELTEMDATFEEVPVDDLVIAEPEEVVEEETPAGDASAEEPADDAVTGEIPAEGETAEGEAESGLQDVAMQLMLTAATDEEMVEALSEGTSVATYDELVAALANGGTITLTADIITVDTAITVPDGTIIDLNGKTLYVNVENSYYNNVTIKNGNIVLGKDDVHVCDGYFLVNEGKTLVLNDVNMSSSAEGIKGYAVFHLNTGANLDLVSSELNISNNEYAGYIVYAGENTATVDITSSTITGSNVNGIVHAATIIDSSTVTLTPVVEHGINRSAVTINDSAVTISGGTGRGITAQHGALMISGDSTVKITDMSEATIQLRNNNGLTINESATVVLDKDVEQYTENGTPSSGEITGTVTIATADIMIGETGYETLDAAIAAANGMTGNVTVEIYGKVEYSSATADLTGAYDSISFVGKTEDAEISITRDGSNGYISGQGNDCTVNFSDLILSKPTGAYANDAGFMNVYFTVYCVGAVNYTNCTFPDGACAQGCPVTYTNCEFANKTSGEYSLWVYANTTTTVVGCKFTGVRGAKMYGEGASKTGNLVMKDTTFTESVTEKPAIVLPYGQSVTLDSNTYPAKGVFELDADGDPNGTTVTADAEEIAKITCINDNGACGVLVNDKIYTTVAQAAAVATSGDTVTLLHNSTETVELAEGVTLNKNGYEAANVTVAAPAVSGTITGCLVDVTDPAETFIASEITGLKATESVAIKLYSGETQIATTTLLKPEYYVKDTLGVKIIITGDSSSWETVWAEDMPRADVVPDKVVLYVDGQEMNSANVPMTSTNGELAVIWADVPGVQAAPVLPDGKLGPGVALDNNDGYTYFYFDISELKASKSLAIKMYSGETLLSTTELSQKGIDEGVLSLPSVSSCVYVAGSDAYWDTVWSVAPVANLVPNKAVLIVDEVEVATTTDIRMYNYDYPANKREWHEINGVQPAQADTYEELAAYVEAGYPVQLTADITATGEINGTDANIDLNGKKLTLTVGGTNFYGESTVANGTIDITGCVASGDCIIGIGDYSNNAILNLNNVNITGDGYSSAYAVLYVYGSSTLNITGGSIVVSDDNATAGGVIKGETVAEGKINITGTESDPVELTFDNAKIGILDGTVVMDYVDLDITGGANAINGSALTVRNSSLTIKDCDGRALTLNNGNVTIVNSTLDFSGATEGEIRFKQGLSLTADESSTINNCTTWTDAEGAKVNDVAVTGTEDNMSTVTVADGVTTVKNPPVGTITPAYTDTTGFWGEGESNASESYVVELYEGETKIASASLNDVNNIIDGVYKNVTWSIPFAGSTDEYWTVDWAEGYPKYDMNPDTVKLIVDGTEVATNNVRFNSPDDLRKIVALAEGFTGGVVAYTSLAEAMGSFNGRKVNVLRDVAEDIKEFSGVTLTTNVEGGVTITNTLDGYIYTMDATIGEGVTVVTSAIFFQAGENTIIGRVEVDNDQFNSGAIYYQGYDAIVNVRDGGSVDVEGSVIFRYNEDDGALNIYGDGDDSTVEFACDYYIGAYSGTFYAEDANIETGYFLLKNSYDESNYADVSMTLDNSSLTVAGTTDGQDSFIIDDQASLTLKNGASIEDVRDFSILAGADLELNIDETSSISATNVSIAEDVCWEAEQNADGTWAFTKTLEGTGTEEDPYLINNLEDLLWFQEKVDEQAADASTQFAGKYFKLTADIDLAGIQWNPIGSMTGDHGSFKGVFDGGEHIISNLTINTTVNGAGLFAYTAGNAEIKNLTLNNVTIKSTANHVGAVVGNAFASTKITNVHVTGTIDISGRGYIGGIAGHGYVVMDTVSVKGEGTISSSFWCAGGILGYGGEGATNITNATVEGTGETGLTIKSAAGGLGSIVGMAEDNNGTQPISGSNLSAKNVKIQTYDGGYSVDTYGEYALGYLYGGNNTSILTGTLSVENVTFDCSTGNTNPAVVDAVAKIGDTVYFDLDKAFEAAADGDEVKILAAGTYALSTSGKNITITGAVDGVVFDNIGAKNMGGADVTFNNVTFDYYPNVNYTGLQHSGNLVYNNCTINGQVFLYGESETFSNCTFNQNSADAYNVWTYGAKKVAFNSCTFNCAGKSVLVYNEGACATELTVTDCDFIANQAVEGNAAIEIDTSSPNKPGAMDGTEITIDAETTATGFGTGSISGNSLWNDKKDLTNLEVWVADKKVWPEALPTATIGHGLQTIVTPSKPREAVTFTVEDVYAESELKVELWSGGNQLSTTTLRQADRDDATATLYPAEGDLTVNIVISGAEAGSWDTVWHVAPTVNNIPDTIKVYVDHGTEPVDTYTDAEGAFLKNAHAAEKQEYIALLAVASLTDADDNVTYYGSLAEAIAAVGAGAVTIELLDDCSLDYNAREAYGTAETTSLTIKGNGHTLTLNQKDSDWSSIGLANADAKLVLSDMTIEKTGYGDTSGAWNTHAINFTCNVEMNSVTVNNSMSVENGATLNNVTINEANGYYGLWIDGNGQTVTVTGGAINATNGGRGIKIADQYVDAPKQVTLTVTDTAFNTANKAAVLVSSAAGAKVTASGVNISKVAEDTVNFVWNDEDYAAYYNSVKVYKECTKAQENEEAFPIKVWYVNDAGEQTSVRAYYTTLDELFAAPATQVPGSNYIDLRGNVEAANQVNVHYATNRVYTFGTSVEGGVTMTFEYADNWNLLPKFDLGENITMDVPYLQVIGGDIEIAGTLNTDYLYLYGTGEGVTITETGVVKANTGDATVQVKGGTVLTVNGELTTGTLNVWTEDTNDSELIVSGENARLTASWIDIWNGTPTVLVENGATLKTDAIKASRGGSITVDGATLVAAVELGHNGESAGTMTVTNNGTVDGEIKLTVVGSTVAGPETLNVTTNLEGYKVVYEEGVHKVAVKTFVAQIGETQYMTLAEAFEAAQPGDTITLLDDTAEVVTIENGKSVTLDLSGKTLTGSILAPNATLTVQNGSIVNNDPNVSAIEINAGTLTLTDVNIESERHAVRIDGAVTATINGGTYKVLVNYERTSHAVNVSGNANVTINGGIFYGPKDTLNGSAMGGSAVNVQLGSTVTIIGGNFSGGVNDTLASVGTLSVTGGTFDQDPSAYVAEGYVAVDNADGTWKVQPIAGTITDIGRTLSLEGEIYINQYVTVEGFDGLDIEKNGGLLVWYADKHTDLTEEAALYGSQDVDVAGLEASGTMYTQQSPGFAAPQYADEVYLRVYVRLADDSYVYSPLKEYSVQRYCENTAKNSGNNALINVCNSILHFGAAAQINFNYNVNDLANIKAGEIMEYNASMLDALDEFTTNIVASELVENIGRTLSLESAVLVNQYFRINSDVDVASAELLVWDGVSDELTVDNVSYTVALSLSDGMYKASTKMFASAEFDKTVFLCGRFTDKDGHVYYSTVKAYSPDTYAKNVIQNSSASEALVKTMKQMVVYGEYADVYFGV